jgi:hypothetical protein
MKAVTWKLRPYQNGDETGILELDRKVFFEQSPDRFSKKYWDWEFIMNPDGVSNIWVADDHGLIVGHYAVIPRLWKIDHAYHMGSIVVDVMTDENYRFQGMFSALGKKSLADSGDKGILFSYGFPVREDVMPGHLKVGWEHIFDIPILVYPQNFIPIIQYYLNNEIISKFIGAALNFVWKGYRKITEGFRRIFSKTKIQYTVREIDTFTEDFDNLWLKASEQFAIVSSRTQAYLNWRYSEHPYYKYRILASYNEEDLVGYAVIRKEKILGLNCGVIVDMFVEHDHLDSLDALVNYVKDFYKSQEDVALIASMISKSNRYYDILKAHSFLLSPKKFWFIVHKNLDALAFNYERLYNQANWLLTWGDTDVM